MGIVIVDGREIEIGDGERLNGIQAALRAGIVIPHYCWHPGLSVAGSCRMCLVEVGTRDPKTGHVTMLPKLAPACNTPVRDGTVLVTNSEKVARARAMVQESLLLRHPIDCPICDKAGECSLQDYHFQYGQPERRADLRPFSSRRRDVAANITLFVDRCVMCGRCVRFCREVSGTSELMVVSRGAHEEIDVMPGFPLDNPLSGNVVDLCPVGALCDKEFLYRQRVWFLRRHAALCGGCASGCSIWIEENQDRIWRIKPRDNALVNQWWICNEGRYGFGHVHSDRRLTVPLRREGGTAEPVEWQAAVAELPGRLSQAGRLAAVFSPFLSVEEAYLLARFMRGIDPEAVLAIGPIPRAGSDTSFPGGFVISGEKCPNRRGVEEVLAGYSGAAWRSGPLVSFEQLLGQLEAGRFGGVWVSGGYPTDWIDPPTASRFRGLRLLVVQDLFPSPLAEMATYALPGSALAERDGSYVNRHDHLQSVRAAVRPPGGVRPEGTLFWELLGRPGLYQASNVLREVAAEIRYFHVAGGSIPELGLNLKLNLLAEGPGAVARSSQSAV